jgi:tRNA-Thr(GGU) m(6)t(6)A37 methyltransferase TsaA
MDLPPVSIEPIGIIHSPFTMLKDMPIQPKGAGDAIGTIELQPQYVEGLADVEGFSHIYLLYYFHQAPATKLTVMPFMDTVPRGVFATRAPVRPSHLGLSVVELVSVDGGRVTVRGIDVLDGTPLLDIKPYIERFDHPGETRSGWMQAGEKDIRQRRSDERFT